MARRKSVAFQNANGVDSTFTNQPVGGPVGVVFQPGWIAQQAAGWCRPEPSGSRHQQSAELLHQALWLRQNSAEQPFLNGDVIVPSPDFHKDVRADITDGIKVPATADVYRASLRLSGGDIVSSGVAVLTHPELTLVLASVGLKMTAPSFPVSSVLPSPAQQRYR